MMLDCLIESIENVFPDENSSLQQMKWNGLDLIDEGKLRKIVEPIQQRMKNMNAEALLKLTRTRNKGARLNSHGVDVKPIHSEVKPCIDHSTCIRYIPIREVGSKYSIGIFIFPPRSKIPLHDHPQMCVISRLLYGDITSHSYDFIEKISDGEQETESSNDSWISNLFSLRPQFHTTKRKLPELSNQDGSNKIYAKAHDIKRIYAPEVTILFPKLRNIHEFISGDFGAAILDVLIPPYDGENRDCTYYKVEPMELKEKSQKRHNFEEQSFWLLPVIQPSDFHCISGYYGDLGDGDHDENDNVQ